MSFMSFDYAMRAADAALQFQQSQGQNIKDTNARAREVGTNNAKRKDDLMMKTIEAEYKAKSANIKKEKAQKLAQLALERKQSAMMTAMLIGGASLAGGMLDGIMDLAKGDPNKVPKSEQMNVNGDDAVKNGYATSFKVSKGLENSETGAMVAFSQDSGNFSLVKLNTTSGQVDGFVNMSATDMAGHIMDRVKNDSSPEAGRLRSMIDQGPPPMFKAEHFKQGPDGKFDLSPALKRELFGGPNGAPAGYFASGSRVGARVEPNQIAGEILKRPAATEPPELKAADEKVRSMINEGPPPSFKPEAMKKRDDGTIEMNSELMAAIQVSSYKPMGDALMNVGKPVGNEAGENMIAGLLSNPAQISKAYGPTAESVMSMLNNDQIRNGLQMDKKTVDKTHDAFRDAGVTHSGLSGAADVFQKTLFKPISTALPQFMELIKVAKEYDEEYKQKMAEYDAARKDAALAYEQLHKLQSLLLAGSNG